MNSCYLQYSTFFNPHLELNYQIYAPFMCPWLMFWVGIDVEGGALFVWCPNCSSNDYNMTLTSKTTSNQIWRMDSCLTVNSMAATFFQGFQNSNLCHGMLHQLEQAASSAESQDNTWLPQNCFISHQPVFLTVEKNLIDLYILNLNELFRHTK